MALEDITAGHTIANLVLTNPAGGDAISQGDDHIRNLKKAIQYTFMNISATVSSVAAELDLAHKGGTVSGSLAVKSDLSVSGSLNVGGATALGATLSVSGSAVMKGTLDVGSTLSTGGTLIGGNVGGAMIATQAQMESASATNLIVSPRRLHYHPGAAKAWGKFSVSASLVTFTGYNILSATQSGSGRYKVRFSTPFSTSDYAVHVLSKPGAGNQNSFMNVASQDSSSVVCNNIDAGGAQTNLQTFYLVAFGDQ